MSDRQLSSGLSHYKDFDVSNPDVDVTVPTTGAGQKPTTYTPYSSQEGERHLYVTAETADRQKVVIIAEKGANQGDALKNAQEAIKKGQVIKVPDGMKPEDVAMRVELLHQAHSKGKPADPDMVKSFATDPSFKTPGEAINRIEQFTGEKHPMRETPVEKAYKSANPQVISPDGYSNPKVNIPSHSTALRSSPVIALGTAFAAGAAALATGSDPAAAADIAGQELLNNPVSQATKLAMEGGDTKAFVDLGKITAGAAMGAALGQAAIPVPVVGAAVGAAVGGAAAAIDPQEIAKAADENQANFDEEKRTVDQVRAMSDDEVKNIKDPGLKQVVTDMREAIKNEDQAQARVDQAGDYKDKQSATTALRTATSNRKDIVSMSVQDKQPDGTGTGDRLKAMLDERERGIKQAPTPEPQEQAPMVAQQRPVSSPGMNI